jgi:hypothetical protein
MTYTHNEQEKSDKKEQFIFPFHRIQKQAKLIYAVKTGKRLPCGQEEIAEGLILCCLYCGEKLLFLFVCLFFWGVGWSLNSVLHSYKSRWSTT